MANEVNIPATPAEITYWESLECAAALSRRRTLYTNTGLMTLPAIVTRIA